ncbi:Protein CBG27489 [Caenorhabditis briggsae]|uniref:Protein CBG27489 n=1 Tax=Caenorhabditis briggsae TaxID=6238 RepID=B6IF04_CAEBR|nr:Protein CBG27489 [Caenorhabditis briggsae]CAR98484.1 Protein CBG27489 [Caenorhabditis briggsae]
MRDNANALQNENIQKNALILQLQEKIRQSEEVIKKAVEEKNEAEEWKGVLATSLTKTTEALKKMTTEKVEENKEMDQLRGELDAEKKKTEAALTLLREERKQRAAEEKKNLENQNAWRTKMKNFNEDKDRNEKELEEALLKFHEKNIEQSVLEEGEKYARRLQLVAEIQKQNEKVESEDTNTSNKPGPQEEEDQKEEPQEDGKKD